MAELMILFDVNRPGVPLRERECYTIFDHSDDFLLKRYRFPRATLCRLCEDLKPVLLKEYRGTNVPVATQVAVALRVLGEGNFQRPSADIYGLSQPSVSRIVEKFCQAVITTYRDAYIKFPASDHDLQTTKTQFLNRFGIPNVLGCIDCTHVEIKAPSINEHLFVNRHQRHSINIQAVCNTNMEFIDVVAKFPGSAHDAFIFSQSELGQRLTASDGRDGYLLGDSGYPLRRWMMVPFSQPEAEGNRERTSFNSIHCGCRALVERSFGILKSRFRLVISNNTHL